MGKKAKTDKTRKATRSPDEDEDDDDDTEEETEKVDSRKQQDKQADLDDDDARSKPVKSQAEANQELLDAAGNPRRVDQTVDKEDIPKGPSHDSGFDAPVAGAGDSHTADPAAAVAAAAGGENAGFRVGEPPAAELDPSNRPLPPGHKDTVVPRNPAAMFSKVPVDPVADEIKKLREETDKLRARIDVLAVNKGV